MNRGQFSFDVIFAIIFLLLALQMFLPLIDSVGESYNRTIIKKQERAIGRELAGVIDSIKGHEGMSIKYTIPEIYVAGKRSAIGCDVDIADAGITINVDSSHIPELTEAITSEIETNNNIGVFTNKKCGQTLTITGTSAGGNIT